MKMIPSDMRLFSQSSVKIKMPNAIGAAREMAVTMESCRGLKFFAEAIEERHMPATAGKEQGTRNKEQETGTSSPADISRTRNVDAIAIGLGVIVGTYQRHFLNQGIINNQCSMFNGDPGL